MPRVPHRSQPSQVGNPANAQPVRRLWAVILAGGDGNRLRSEIVQRTGRSTPKQFCDFGAGVPLVVEAVHRAERLVPRDRILVSTSRRHRYEAQSALARVPGVRVIEQPANADTTPGLLLPALSVLAEDPDAILLVLPADHFVDDDARFMRALGAAADHLIADPHHLGLLGVDLKRNEEDYGWVEPGQAHRDGWHTVLSFREKPPAAEVPALRARGALINTFAMAVPVRILTELIAEHVPRWWKGISETHTDPGLLEYAYRILRPSNFSTDVLHRAVGKLRVSRLEGVEWTDVGTPDRLTSVYGPARPRPLLPSSGVIRPFSRPTVGPSLCRSS